MWLETDTESTGTLHYKSSNKKVAVVDNEGYIRMKGIGKAKIWVWQDADEKYCAAEKQAVQLTVLPPRVHLRKLLPGKGRIFVRWKKPPKGKGFKIKGYEIQIVSKTKREDTYDRKEWRKSRPWVTAARLKKGRRYYICVRAIVKVKGQKKVQYGAWSKEMSARAR